MVLRGTVLSTTLEMDTGITVVTPYRFDHSGPYKVAYLLHGLTGNSSSWIDYSMLPMHAGAGSTVYILPETYRSFYTDMRHGGRYFSYLTEELPRICKQVFNLSAERENTAVIGASLGGYGALKCALRYPERYGMCAAISSSCLFLKEGMAEQRARSDEAEYVAMMGPQLLHDFTCAFGEDLVWCEEEDVSALAGAVAGRSDAPRLYGACGTNDPFRADNARYYEQVRAAGYDCRYEEWEGTHDFVFFDQALQKAIGYFGL